MTIQIIDFENKEDLRKLKELISNKELNKIDILKNIYIQFPINLISIDNLIFKILNLIKLGFSNFILNFDNDKLSYSSYISILKRRIFNILIKIDIKIYIKNIPICIFENQILTPKNRHKFENKLFYFENKIQKNKKVEKLKRVETRKEENKFEEEKIKKVKETRKIYIKNCFNCKYRDKSCDGINQDYLEKYGNSEFKAIISNKILAKKYKNYINEEFKNKYIIDKFNLVLEHFKNEIIYLKNWIVFVKSFPDNLEESSNERFVYYIFNSKKPGDKIKNLNFLISFFKRYLDLDLLKNNKINDNNNQIENNNLFLKNIFEKVINSKLIVLSSSLMDKNKIRETIYFTIDDLNEKEKINLLRHFNLNRYNNINNKNNYGNYDNFSLNLDNIWGIGIDIKEINKNNDLYLNNFEFNFKLYYRFENISKKNILDFIQDIPNKNKLKINKFLENIENKNFNTILFDLKFKKGELYSKRIDFSSQFDSIDNNILIDLLNLDESFFDNKDLYTISFELYKNNTEKINLYWNLK